jgi:TonB-linked SusC/RagA family outer membrane protein
MRDLSSFVDLRRGPPARRCPPACRTRAAGRSWNSGLLLALLALAPVPLAAQGIVAGTVVRAGMLTPIEGATVGVDGTRLGAITDAAGRFRIANVPGEDVVLRVRRINYQPVTQRVRVGTDARIVLAEATVRLDEVVVTGTAGAETRRGLGNTVSTISTPEALQSSGASDVGSLINARAPGVIVTMGSGRAGSGPSINVRGRSTISLSQQPLIYIDGVRVVNDIGTGPRTQGGSQISRLNDVRPEDIESIEIIKGPAAATIYGTEASNGVVQIITKQGQAGGTPRWNASLRQGTQWFMNPEGRIPTNYGKDASGNIVTWNAVAQENARGTPIWTRGRLQGYSASVSGGVPTVRYFLSSTYDQDQGIEPNNHLRQFGGHANITLAPSEKLDIASSMNIVKGRTYLGADYGFGGFWGALYGSPLTANTLTRGFNLAPPEVAWTQFENTQDVSRFTVSARLSHRPLPWLSQRLTVGLDDTNEDNQALSSFLPPEYRPFFSASAARGSLLQDIRGITFISGDYGATAKAALTPSIGVATSIGGQYYRKRYNTTQVSGREFPAPGLRSASAAAIRDGSQEYLVNTTLGFYGQEQVSWNDRLFLTGAVRVDNNSAFGEDFKLATYPKISASWVVSEEPFWKHGIVNTLKLRAAYGASGQQPDVFSALRSYQPVTGTLDQPAVTPQFVGNPDLRPERGVELEAGFEAGILDRLSLEFTYFNKRTRDAILSRPVAPSLGFPGSQFVNIGEVSNRGIELQARLQALAGERIGWDIDANIGTARDRIEDLGGIPFVAVPGLPQRHVQGYPIGGYWGKRVVSATITATGATNIMCEGAPETQGAPLPCASAPVVYLGTITPTVAGAVGSTLTLGKQLRLHGLVDFKRGHRLLDTDAVIRCAIFRLCEVNVRPDLYDPRYVGNAQLGSALLVVDQFINDASFAKLRELSATYVLPARAARLAGAQNADLTVAGRNLHTWTNYPGLDPERRATIATIGSFDQAVTPALAQLIVTLQLTF